MRPRSLNYTDKTGGTSYPGETSGRRQGYPDEAWDTGKVILKGHRTPSGNPDGASNTYPVTTMLKIKKAALKTF